MRDGTNSKQSSVLSHERATGTSRFVPGATWLDTSDTATPTQQIFHPGFSREGRGRARSIHDTKTAVPDRVLAFDTNGLSPAIDTTATTPGTLQRLAIPNTDAANAMAIWVFPSSWHISAGGALWDLPIGSDAIASRAEFGRSSTTRRCSASPAPAARRRASAAWTYRPARSPRSTITDASIRFTCSPVLGVVRSVGTGSASAPVAYARAEWVPIDGGAPVSLTGPAAGTQSFQVIGTDNGAAPRRV